MVIKTKGQFIASPSWNVLIKHPEKRLISPNLCLLRVKAAVCVCVCVCLRQTLMHPQTTNENGKHINSATWH